MASERLRFLHAFLAAILAKQVKPHFQPIVSLRDATLVGFEVLARWVDPEFGTVSPSRFIPIAESEGILYDLTKCLIRQAFAAAARWPERLFLAVNVSPAQLQGDELPRLISDSANELGFPLSRLHIEITETAVLKDPVAARSMVDRFLGFGCHIVMDDFGTGFASLTWLQSLPFTKIKIDASFVRSMIEHRESRKIVVSVVGLGQSLGLSVVAEGVETEAQADLLRQIGCEFAQGFLFGAAAPAEAVPALIEAATTSPGSLARKLSLEQRSCQITAIYNAPVLAIGFISPDLIIVDANEIFARRLASTRMGVIGSHICDAFPDREHCFEFYRRQISSSNPINTFELDLPSGGTDLVVLQGVNDEAGEFLGYSFIGIDVTESKRMGAALREAAGYPPGTSPPPAGQ
ncbi:EAL domain-containing protein [Singulisphaera sp. PoT]|uniref:sensor domain-containing phosphodiesterase n=1 Tax=Singulisphaera sp. PoT TaxID=3411797 RepID=UPI003BF4B9BD